MYCCLESGVQDDMCDDCPNAQSDNKSQQTETHNDIHHGMGYTKKELDQKYDEFVAELKRTWNR